MDILIDYYVYYYRLHDRGGGKCFGVWKCVGGCVGGEVLETEEDQCMHKTMKYTNITSN